LYALFNKQGWTNALIVENSPSQTRLYLAHRNIPNVNLLTYDNLNVYDILKHKHVLLHRDVIPLLEEAMKHRTRFQKKQERLKQKAYQKKKPPTPDFVVEQTVVAETSDLNEFYSKVIEEDVQQKQPQDTTPETIQQQETQRVQEQETQQEKPVEQIEQKPKKKKLVLVT